MKQIAFLLNLVLVAQALAGSAVYERQELVFDGQTNTGRRLVSLAFEPEAIAATNANVVSVENGVVSNLSSFGTFTFDGDLLPTSNNVWSIGSPSQQVESAHLGPDSLHLGALSLGQNSNELVISTNTVRLGNSKNVRIKSFGDDTLGLDAKKARLGNATSNHVTFTPEGGNELLVGADVVRLGNSDNYRIEDGSTPRVVGDVDYIGTHSFLGNVTMPVPGAGASSVVTRVWVEDQGYLTNAASADDVTDLSNRVVVIEGQTNDWNDAHSWGDHALAGYSTNSISQSSLDVVSNLAVNASNLADDVQSGLDNSSNGWNDVHDWALGNAAGYDDNAENRISQLETQVVTNNDQLVNGADYLVDPGVPVVTNTLGYEADPVYESSPAGGITTDLINNWGDAYSWGDHQNFGYLTAETDPYWAVYSNSVIQGIGDWGTAFGWGDHSIVGYLTNEVDPVWSNVSNDYVRVTELEALVAYHITDSDTQTWGNAAIEVDALEAYLGGQTQNFEEVYQRVIGDGGNGGVNVNDQLSILEGRTNEWNLGYVRATNAYGWGDHSLVGYLTSYTETDPVWTGVSNLYAFATDVPTNNAQLVNGAGYLTGYTETDPLWNAASNNFPYKAEDAEITGDWEKSSAAVAGNDITRYIDVTGLISTHAGVVDAHHTRYTDAEALNAVSNATFDGSNILASGSTRTNELTQDAIDYLRNKGDRLEARVLWDDIDDLGVANGPYASGLKITGGQDDRVTAILERPDDLDTNETVEIHWLAWPNQADLTAGNTGIVWRLDVRFFNSGELMTNAPAFSATITNYFANTAQYSAARFFIGGEGAYWSDTHYASLELSSLGSDPASTFDARLGLQTAATLRYRKK